jgi:hypothetical protein
MTLGSESSRRKESPPYPPQMRPKNKKQRCITGAAQSCSHLKSWQHLSPASGSTAAGLVLRGYRSPRRALCRFPIPWWIVTLLYRGAGRVATAGVAIGRICNTLGNQEAAVLEARFFWTMTDSGRPPGQQARTCEARLTNAVALTTLRRKHGSRAKIIPHLVLARRRQAVHLLLVGLNPGHVLVRLEHALCPAVVRRIPSTDQKARLLGSHQCTNPTRDCRPRSRCCLLMQNAWQRSKVSYRPKRTTMRCTREGSMSNSTTCSNHPLSSRSNSNSNSNNITSARERVRRPNQPVRPTLKMGLGLSQVPKKVIQAVPVPAPVVGTALLPRSQVALISRVIRATRLRRQKRILRHHTTLRPACLTSTKTRKNRSRGRRKAAWAAL